MNHTLQVLLSLSLSLSPLLRGVWQACSTHYWALPSLVNMTKCVGYSHIIIIHSLGTYIQITLYDCKAPCVHWRIQGGCSGCLSTPLCALAYPGGAQGA